tara:strand:+ start:1234 stop:1791 length:558 start_codon:yes stop_codon:yes gene_type:complete
MKLTDLQTWSEPLLDLELIKKFNQTIVSNINSTEEIDQGAKDLKGDYLKNIKPKNIQLLRMPEEYNRLIHLAFHFAHYTFGALTFPPNMYDNLLYNVYSSSIRGHYGEHMDRSRDAISDCKLTFLLNLSEDEYEGGDLIVNKEVTNFKKPGSAILFRSFLNHEVTPVTKGERITLSYFINGPKSI